MQETYGFHTSPTEKTTKLKATPVLGPIYLSRIYFLHSTHSSTGNS